MLYLFFTILGFALGSTLFAYWTPKIIRHIDIRELPADHNPGVANAFMYGGFFCGLLSLILELAKGFVCSGISRAALFRYSLAAFYSGAHRPGVRTRISIFPKRKRRQSNYRLLWSPARSVSGDASGSVPCIFLYFLFPDRCGQPTFFPVCRYFWTVCIMRAVYRKSSIHPDWKLSDRCGRDLPAFYQIPRRAAPHTAFQTYSIASRLCCFFLLHTIQLTSTGLHVRPPSQAP